MLKIHLELQDIWHQKSCAGKIIQLLWIILPLVSWHMSACTENVHIKVNPEKKSEITFCQNKYKLKKEKFQEDGQLKQLISSIKWFKENRLIDLETMEHKKSKIILGLEISHGKICRTESSMLLSFLQKKKTLTKKISMKNGKILMILNLKRIPQIFDVVLSNRYLTVITLIIN